MFNSPTRPGFSKFPRPMSNLYKEKMSAPNNAYYVLTQAHAGLPNSVLTTALTTSLIPDTHNVYNLGSDGQRWKDLYLSHLTEIDTILIRSGSITDTTGAIDFGNENLLTTGSISGGTITDGTASLTGGAWTGATYNGLGISTAASNFDFTLPTAGHFIFDDTFPVQWSITDKAIGGINLIVAGSTALNQPLLTTSSPLWVSAKLQDGAGVALRIGADAGATTITDSTRKFGRIGMPHYDTDEEDPLMMSLDSQAGLTAVNFGGGSSDYNAATKLGFWTAPNTTTLQGTRKMEIDSDGTIGMGSSATLHQSLLHLTGTIDPVIRIQNTAGAVDDFGGIMWKVSSNVADDYFNAGIFFLRTNATFSTGGKLIFAMDDTGAGNVAPTDAKMTLLQGGNVGIGVTDPHSKLEVDGAISSATLTITASADDADVSGVNSVFINITSDIILGGLTGGVNGQVVHFAIIGNFTNKCTFEHTEGVSDQDFYCHTEADESIDAGGLTFVCNGSDWYDVSHARHV